MSSVCRICLAGNTSLQSLKNNLLRCFYEKLTNAKFNSEDAKPRALCCYCYQKLLRCHTFSQMAVRSEKIFHHLYDSGLEVNQEYITEVKLNMKQHLSVATNVGSQVNIKDEPLTTEIDIKVEVTTEPDTLLEVESYPKDCIKNQLTFKESISGRDNDVEQILSNTRIDQSKPENSSFNIKDEPLSSIEIKEEVTPELDKLVEIELFPEHSKRSQSTFEKDYCDQEDDAKELLRISHVEQTKQDHTKMQFSCKYCNNMFNKKSNLISHIRNSHSQVKGKQYCSTKKHTETTSMIADKTSRNKKKKLACHECDKTFDNKSSLIRHIRTHTGEKPFACIVCDKQYNRKDHLVFHMSTHTGEKPFTCNVCDKQFYKKSSLVLHMRTHTDEKPFACNVCDKQFNRKDRLLAHMRTHTGEKPFGCRVCDKQFNVKSNLVAHVRIHMEVKPFACQVCDKKFTHKCNLVSHMRTHTGEKLFTCFVCDKQFNRNDRFVTHIRTHAPQKLPKPESPRWKDTATLHPKI